MKRRIIHPALSVAVLLLLNVSQIARACTCPPTPPPCRAVHLVPLVFLGTVVSAREGQVQKAKMRVDRSFKGSLPAEVDLFDNGMCDGPNLEVGKQYLMYTFGDPAKALPVRGCSRSRSVEYAAEDLQFLDAFMAGKVSTEIRGTLRHFGDEGADATYNTPGKAAPLADIPVTITNVDPSSEPNAYQTKSDAQGRFSLSGLPPGKYEVNATMAGHITSKELAPLHIVAQSCAVATVLLKVDRRVQGWVRTRAGDPVAGARVQMARSKPTGNGWEDRILEARSGEDGFYSISEIPSGDFHLGINLAATPSRQSPYAPLYYPDSKNVKGATMLTFAEGPAVFTYDLIAPPKLKPVRVLGKVSNAKGLKPEERATIRFKKAGHGGIFESRSPELDSEGRFAMELHEGIRYVAYSLIRSPKGFVYSEAIEFTAGDAKLNFVLDKSPLQFSAIRRKIESQ